MNNEEPTKPDFMTLREHHHFDIAELAQAAMVLPETVHRMLIGEPVPRDFAAAVLGVYSKRAGVTYTLENVDVRTKERRTP